MATTYTTYLDKPKFRREWTFAPNHKLVRVTVNFAEQTLDASASDVQQLITVPANTMVLRCWPVVTTAGTNNASVHLGYGSDPNYWGNAIAIDNTGCNIVLVANSAARTTSAIVDGASETTAAITADGAAYGDTVSLGFSAGNTLLTAGSKLINLTTAVVGANSVMIVMDNETGANVDPVGTFTVYVNKAPRGHIPIVLSTSASDTIDITAVVNAADADPAAGIMDIYAELLSLGGSF